MSTAATTLSFTSRFWAGRLEPYSSKDVSREQARGELTAVSWVAKTPNFSQVSVSMEVSWMLSSRSSACSPITTSWISKAAPEPAASFCGTAEVDLALFPELAAPLVFFSEFAPYWSCSDLSCWLKGGWAEGPAPGAPLPSPKHQGRRSYYTLIW